MNQEQYAKEMHDLYEASAKFYSWDTQEKCKVEFEKLPEKNKKVMLTMAHYVEEQIKEARLEVVRRVLVRRNEYEGDGMEDVCREVIKENS